MGGRPYSGKAKKAQMQAKRAKKAAKYERERHGSDDDAFAPPREGPTKTELKETLEEGKTTKNGEEYKNDKRSVFRKESKVEVDKRRAAAQVPYGPEERVFNNGVSVDEWYQRAGEQWFYPVPERPRWAPGDSDATIQRREEKAFARWIRSIDLSAGEIDLNLFERNLEVWRELWRVSESSDVVAIVADARHPLYHIPLSLLNYLRDTLKKPVFVVLNKIDLLPREVLEDWRRYFAKWLPDIPIVEFSCHPARETVTLDPTTTQWRRKRTRDSRKHVNYAELARGQDANDAPHSDDDSASLASETSREGDDLPAPADAQRSGGKKVRFDVDDGVPIAPQVGAPHKHDDDDDDAPVAQQQQKKKSKRGKKGGLKPDRHAEPKIGVLDPSKGSKSLADELMGLSIGASDDDEPPARGGGGRQQAKGRNKRGKQKHADPEPQVAAAEAPVEVAPTTVREPKRGGKKDRKGKRGAPQEEGSDAEVASAGSDEVSDHDLGALAGLDVDGRHHNEVIAPHENFKGREKLKKADDQAAMPHAERAEVARLINELLDTAKELCRERHGDSFFTGDRKMIMGTVGSPNVGKSSLVNALKGHRVVSTSSTAGHTKHLQHIPLDDELMLCDCPGLAFPTRGLPRHAQLLMGSFAIAQNREPYSLVHFLGRHLPLERIYHLNKPRGADPDEPWSGYAFCEAYAEKNGCFLHRGKGLPDTYRGGQAIVKEAVTGTLLLHFCPPKLDTPPPGMVAGFGDEVIRDVGSAGEEAEEDDEEDEYGYGGDDASSDGEDEGIADA